VVTDRQTVLERPLRFVVFGGSIASDWGNPAATSARAVLSAIAAAGHEVTFHEQRGNPALAGLLANRGSRGYTAFTNRFPEIQFRTYDLPRGWERTVWFGREIATADAVVALPGTPAPLLLEIAALDTRRIVRLVDESLAVERSEFTLVRSGGEPAGNRLAFGPAVRKATVSDSARGSRPLLVAYDDPEAAESTRSRIHLTDPILVQAGTAALPGWQYLPEIELCDWYMTCRAAVVTGAGASPWAVARHMLPLAAGCHQCEADPDSIAAAIADPRLASVPLRMDAETQASALITSVSRFFRR
jgi:hypothetical protein